VVAIGGLATACSYPTDDTPYPGACTKMHPVTFVPLRGSVAVPTDIVIRVVFDDYPDPDTVRSSSLLLTTGYFWVPGTYGVDLIGKAAVLRPIGDLSPELGYGLHLRPSLRSLGGCPGTITDIDFITGEGPARVPEQETPPFASVQEIFGASCGGGRCHLATRDSGGGCLAAPAAGLSLCAADAWDQLVGVRSSQDNQIRLVEQGDSARSYLLRKLLPASHTNGPITGVYGQREPPGAPLPEDQLRLIAAWIDGGALR
jgi:hypothetical protein